MAILQALKQYDNTSRK